MRITIVLGPFLSPPPAPAGAVEKRWSRKARIFAARGHEVTVICRDHPDLPRDEFIDGVRWIRVKGADRSGSIYIDLIRDLPYSLRARRVLPEADVTITNCFWLPALLRGKGRWGALNVHVARVPKGQLWLYRHAKRISTVSRHMADLIAAELADGQARVRYVNNPVDVDVFRPSERKGDERTICYTGRIHPEKGLHVLAGAVRLLRERDPRWRLRAVGELSTRRGGGGEAYRRKILDAAGTAEAVVFPGSIRGERELADAIRSCRYYVYPSLAKDGEAFGIAPLEAMSAGVPPVVSELDVFRDFVVDGENGVVVPCLEGGAEARLAEAIELLDRDPDRYEAMRASGVRMARHFDYEAVADRYLLDFAELARSSVGDGHDASLRINIVLGPFLPPPPALTGAVEKVWWSLGREFIERGHEVTVIARASSAGGEATDPGNPRLVEVPGETRSGWIYLDLLRDIRYSRRVSRILPPADITITNCFWLPVILGRRSGDWGMVNVHVQRFPKRQMWLYGRAARISTVSRAISQQISHQQPSLTPKIRVIGNPVDLEVYRERAMANPDGPAKLLLYTGRIHPEKGLDLLVQAWRRLRRSRPWLRLRLVGPQEVAVGGGGSAYIRRLRSLAGDADLEIGRPLSSPRDLADTLAEADVYIYPSVAFFGEASPVAPLEAMSIGLPVIVSDLPQFEEYLVPGETGLIFRRRSGDPVAELTSAIGLLVDDPAERRRLRENAIRKVKEFSYPSLAERYLMDFQELLRDRRREQR